eukprot:847624-Prymnesium_polylepis.1
MSWRFHARTPPETCDRHIGAAAHDAAFGSGASRAERLRTHRLPPTSRLLSHPSPPPGSRRSSVEGHRLGETGACAKPAHSLPLARLRLLAALLRPPAHALLLRRLSLLDAFEHARLVASEVGAEWADEGRLTQPQLAVGLLEQAAVGVDRLHVEVVGRLVEQQHVRPHRGDRSEDDARLLTARELLKLELVLGRGQALGAQLGAHLLVGGRASVDGHAEQPLCTTTSGHAGSGHAGSGHAESGHAGSGHAESGHAESGHAGRGHAGSGRVGSGRAGSGRAGSGHAGSGHAGSGHAGSGRAEAVRSNTGRRLQMLHGGDGRGEVIDKVLRVASDAQPPVGLVHLARRRLE